MVMICLMFSYNQLFVMFQAQFRWKCNNWENIQSNYIEWEKSTYNLDGIQYEQQEHNTKNTALSQY